MKGLAKEALAAGLAIGFTVGGFFGVLLCLAGPLPIGIVIVLGVLAGLQIGLAARVVDRIERGDRP